MSDIFGLWTLGLGSDGAIVVIFDLYLMAVCILHNFNCTKSDVSRPRFEGGLLRSCVICGTHLEQRSKWKNERGKNCQSNENQNNWQPHKRVPYFSYQTTFWDTDDTTTATSDPISQSSLNWVIYRSIEGSLIFVFSLTVYTVYKCGNSYTIISSHRQKYLAWLIALYIRWWGIFFRSPVFCRHMFIQFIKLVTLSKKLS